MSTIIFYEIQQKILPAAYPAHIFPLDMVFSIYAGGTNYETVHYLIFSHPHVTLLPIFFVPPLQASKGLRVGRGIALPNLRPRH